MNNQNSNSKILFPIFGLVFAALLYFLYSTFFSSTTTSVGGNEILKNTKLGQGINIINKEGISFNSNTVNYFSNTKDFTRTVSPSNGQGRENPFLP